MRASFTESQATAMLVAIAPKNLTSVRNTAWVIAHRLAIVKGYKLKGVDPRQSELALEELPKIGAE